MPIAEGYQRKCDFRPSSFVPEVGEDRVPAAPPPIVWVGAYLSKTATPFGSAGRNIRGRAVRHIDGGAGYAGIGNSHFRENVNLQATHGNRAKTRLQ